MNIKIEFIGFPLIYDLFPVGAHSWTFAGETLPELIEDLIARNESRVREGLLDARTKTLDPAIQIAVNGKFVMRDDIPRQKITEGDQVTFFMLLAGG